jgi:formylglycine-generating enzyme required for sulfatase activity
MTGKDYRLLSEAEWEYAARAGSQERWSFGGDEVQLGDYAWYNRNSQYKTHPVSKKKPNALGLYDMHGDVSQWVEDPYHVGYDGAPLDGSVWRQGGDESNRVVRGGHYADDSRLVRSASRDRFPIGYRGTVVSIRVARTLTP